jgi:uncharacterized repeat protein (TIGR01451 family)
MNRLARSVGVLLALGLIESTQMLWFPKPMQAQVSAGTLCAAPGKDGVDLGAINIVNSYFSGPSTDTALNAGSTSIAVGSINSSGSQTTISPGDLLLIIQMQDADINYTDTNNYGAGNGTGSGSTAVNNTGLYEYVVAKNSVGAGGGSLQIQGAGAGGGLLYTYRQQAATATHGQRTYQVVRVPQYTNATLSGTIRSPGAWNGKSGGIVVIDVANTFTMSNGTVEVQDKGFRGGGGTTNTDTYPDKEDEAFRTDGGVARGGVKGEGIAGTPLYVFDGTNTTNTGIDGYPRSASQDSYTTITTGATGGGSRARGAPGNAGGGGDQHNSGGGGGSNWGAGGQGGNSINSPPIDETPATGVSKPVGGRGGAPFSTATVNRLVMGGGGGAGDANNGVAGSGGLGGGIVIIRAGTITGTGSVSARARDGVVTPTDDGGSGAGAGGSILITAKSGSLAGIALNANGGKGGDTNTKTTVPYDFGPGGGGGGGVIFSSLPVSTATVSGGQPGKSFNGQLGTATTGVTRGAAAGTDGKIEITGTTSSSTTGASSGADCSVTLSGQVWKDVNGSITKDGSEAGTDAGGLYVYLVDSSNNVLAKSSVQSDGTYSIVAPINTSATLRLSTDGTKNYGQVAPAASLPSGWINTGENKNGVTETVTPGEIAIATTTNSITNQNFGVNVGVAQGFKSVKLTNDADNSATVSPGDGLTWTVSYANTSTVDIANFQITDILPAQMTIASTGAQVITVNSIQGTVPAKNANYTGAGNNTLFAPSPSAILKAGGVITISIPVTVKAGTANTTPQNQATAIGNGLPAQGVLSDNVDSTTGSLPSGVTIPANSITQSQNSNSTDPTIVSVVSTSSYIKSPYSGKVVINEVLYKQTASTTAGNDEFIELYNPSNSTVDLSGWKLIDGNLIVNNLDGTSGNITGTATPYVFPNGTTLAPNAYAVIWIGTNNPNNQAAGAAFQAWLGTDPKLNDAGEDLWLYDAQTQIVDYIAYGTTSASGAINTPPPTTLNLWDSTYQSSLAGAAAGQSISLTPNGQDTNTSACWEQTTSGAASSRCPNYLPTRDTDPVVIGTGATAVNRVTSVGVNNNGLSTNLLLVKRITSINGSTTAGSINLATYNQIDAYPYDDNVIETNLTSTTQYPMPDTDKWPNTTGKATSSFLLGVVNGGNTKPKDEIEYTIYFLSTGTAPAQRVTLCDRIPANQTFIPNGYNSVPQAPGGNLTDRGIAVSYAGNYLSYTNLIDGDTAQYFAPQTALPAACGAAANTTGAVVINLGASATNTLGGTVPQATSAGSPTSSYGFVRFKAKVN